MNTRVRFGANGQRENGIPDLKSEKNRKIFTRWESRENRTSGGNSKHLYPIFKAELIVIGYRCATEGIVMSYYGPVKNP